MNRRTTIGALAVLLVIVLFIASGRILDGIQLVTGWGLPQRAGPPLLIVSHHGDLDAHPENSAEAIWAAAALGADGIELDVHLSASGTWYLIHDPTLDRTTDGTGRISALADEVIDAAVVDAGLGFTPGGATQYRVPRLEAVLDGLRDYRGVIYLDLQHAESGDAVALLDFTDGMRVAVICRSGAEAAAIKARDPEVETLLDVALPPTAGVDGLLGDANLHATPRLMERWTLPLTVYVDEELFDRDEYQVLRLAWSVGVKAFITNHLAEALARRDAFVRDEP